MNISSWGKRAYKKLIPGLPGYHAACLTFRQARPAHWEWVDRIPVKPGMLVPVRTGAGDFYMTRPERCSIAKKFFWTRGEREPAEDRVALDVFSAMARAADVVLDIGANSGLFSLAAARASSKVEIVAFDILPEAIHILFDNLVVNSLVARVELQLMGVGRSGATFMAPFESISSEMPTSLSLELPQLSGKGVPVPVKSLDEICIPRFVGKQLAIKIDVEGTEVEIFEHGQATLEALAPWFVCEVLTTARQPERYDRLLENFGYRRFLITDEGLSERPRIEAHPRFKDWVFLPEKASFDLAPFLRRTGT